MTGSISLQKTDAVGPGDALPRNLSIRGVHYKDPASGDPMYAMTVASPPEPDAGANDGPQDLYLSGGGSATVEMMLMAVHGDYVVGWPTQPILLLSITCSGTTATATTAGPHGLSVGYTFNGMITGATPSAYNVGSIASPAAIKAASANTLTYGVPSGTASPATSAGAYQADTYMAKPWKLRCSRTSEVGADGTHWSLTYPTAAPSADPTAVSGDFLSGNVTRQKQSTASTDPDYPASELETVTPEWLKGDIFYAEPYPDGVTNGYNTASPPARVIMYDLNGVQIAWITHDSSRNWTSFS